MSQETTRFGVTILGLGFMFGLSIPRFSNLALLLGAGWLLLRPFRLPRVWRLTVPLLLLFTFLHEGISVYYGYREPGVLLMHPLIFLAAYFLGLVLPSVEPFRDGRWVMRFFMMVALGMATFALLGAALKPIRIEGADILRKSPSFWDSSLTLNGTVYGLYASVGMVLLPLALFRGRKLLNLGLWDGLLAGGAGVIGLAANLLFQNRSPLLALAASLAWITGFLLFRPSEFGAARRAQTATRLALLAFGMLGIVLAYQEQLMLALFRFQTVGLGTNGRSEAWGQMLTHFFDQPFGGRQQSLAGLSYAHNLWLDVANDSGLLSLLVLNLLLGVHLIYFGRSIWRSAGVDRQVLLVLFISSMVGAALEPLLIGSPSHFALMLMLFGWMVNLGSRSSVPEPVEAVAWAPAETRLTHGCA